MRKAISWLFIAFTILLQVLPARAAATLLPNGEQCFQATSPTSGGLSGPLLTLGSITGGTGYVNGTYTNVPLTGGSGFGGRATITVTGNIVVNVALTNFGTHFAAGDVLSASNANLGGSGSGFSVPVLAVSTTGTGMLGLMGPIIGGTGGVTGTYGGVVLTGGSGSGATANITVAGGAVTGMTILNPGLQFVVGDTLSAASGSIGGVTGFSVQVSSVTINQALAGGFVSFYVPNTNTFKQTWQNAAQTILNANPVTLDQNGCATIYGIGTYRQVLQDALGDIVWDKLTTDTSAQQNIFWAGIAGGTPNAITLIDPGFNATDGSILDFTALFTNTAATTINPSGFGAITVLKDTTAGPVGLTGGEIIQNNPIEVVYRSLDNAFHILNPVIQSASGATAPLCGASGLKITNTVGNPDSVLALTATQIVMQTASGLSITRSNINLTNINITVGTGISTANGMDGESPGTSAWVYIFAVDNGAATAGLVSAAAGNGQNPILPSGYTYKCFLGSMRVDGTSKLLRTAQFGNRVQFQVTTASNTSLLPIIASGVSGSITVPTYTPVSITNFVPLTAAAIILNLEVTSAASNNGAMVAPNGAYGAINAGGGASAPLSFFNAGASNITLKMMGEFNLESLNVFYASSMAGATLQSFGWVERVNAN